MSDKAMNVVVRAISGALFVAIMVVGICFRPEAMILLFCIITGMTMWEYTGLVNSQPEICVNRFISTAAGVYLFIAFAGFCGEVTPSAVFIPYLLSIVYLFVSELYTNNKNALHDWAYTMLGQMYIALPFACINVLAFRSAQDGVTYYDYLVPLCIFVFLWVNDTGAFCAGTLFGKHRLFPRISPKKSWEGSIGGGLLVLATAVLVFYLVNRNGNSHYLSLPEWLGLALVVVIFGTWGDLVESLLKRTLGIKDSGNIIPGHGGMLDRFDSSLLAIPAAVIYLYSLQLLA